LVTDHIVALGLTADRWTYNGKPGFLVVSGSKQSLFLACYADSQYMPITATIEDQYGKKIFSHTFQSKGRVQLELPNIPAKVNRLFIIKTDKFWTQPKTLKRKLGVRITPKNLN
jgi:hypothetical protein